MVDYTPRVVFGSYGHGGEVSAHSHPQHWGGGPCSAGHPPSPAKDLRGPLTGGSGFISSGSTMGHKYQGTPQLLVWPRVLGTLGVGWDVIA